MRNLPRGDGERGGVGVARRRWMATAEGLEPRTLLSATDPLDAKHGPLAKIGSELIGTWGQYQATLHSHGATAAAAFRPNDPLLHLSGGNIQIEAYTSGNPATLAGELAAIGATSVQSYVHGATASVPARAISALAALPDLTFARPAWYTTNAGSVTSQGDPAIRGDA